MEAWLDWLQRTASAAAARRGRRSASRAAPRSSADGHERHSARHLIARGTSSLAGTDPRLPLSGRTVKVMNVCGGHERSITMAGLRGALPARDRAGSRARAARSASVRKRTSTRRSSSRCRTGVILVAFGDMLRVPVNVPKGETALARTGARRRRRRAARSPSPLEAVWIARENPDRQVVFFAAGFETTTAPIAAMLAEGVPDNLSILLVRPPDLAGGGNAAGFRERPASTR